MSEQGLTREQVEHLVCDGGDDSAELYLAHDAQQREQIERLSYCLQVHGDVLGETAHKHEQQVAIIQAELEQFQGIFGEHDEPPRSLAQARAMWDALKKEHDEYKRKYHEVMDIMGAWKNIDHAEAVARLLEVEKERDALKAELEQVRQERDGWRK